jgi:hypothetical protein
MSAKLKRVLETIGFAVLSIALSIGVGWSFDHFYPNAAAGTSWVVGMLTFLIIETLEVLVRTAAHSDRQLEILTQLAISFRHEGSSRLLLHEALCFSGRQLSESETNTAWQKLSWFAEREYLVTNYINPDSFFATGLAKNVIQLQKAKQRVNETFQIRKVLIWRDAAERNSAIAQEILRMQQDDTRAMMGIREINYETIKKRAWLMDDLRKELGGRIDFAVFDSLAVVIWNLDDRREVKFGEVVVAEAEVIKFQRFFQELAKEADPIRGASTTTHANEREQQDRGQH